MHYWQKLLILGSVFAVTTLSGGCASSNYQTYDQAANDKGEKIVRLSKEQIGSPYRYGGQSPSGFDCSGLVRYVYRKVGIDVPHSSRLLYKSSRKVSLQKIQPGDLLFFRISRSKVSHVGIYAEGGQFIHAPSSGKHVSLARLDNPYWEKRLVGAGRFH
jgi:cell wall-associated NlpC family hydrolase